MSKIEIRNPSTRVKKEFITQRETRTIPSSTSKNDRNIGVYDEEVIKNDDMENTTEDERFMKWGKGYACSIIVRYIKIV